MKSKFNLIRSLYLSNSEIHILILIGLVTLDSATPKISIDEIRDRTEICSEQLLPLITNFNIIFT